MKMLSVSPFTVGVYNGVTETNLGDLRVVECMCFRVSSCFERYSPYQRRARRVRSGLDLSLWIAGLDNHAHNRDIHPLGANVVGGGNHGNVNI